MYLTEGIYVLVVTKNISKQAFTTYSMYNMYTTIKRPIVRKEQKNVWLIV